jgi:hypothetical protein
MRYFTMKNRKPILCLLVALASLLGASPASAQKAPRLQLFAGYSYLRFDSTTIGFPDYSNLHGAELSGAFNISRNFGIIADVGDHFGNHQRVYEYLFGPQFLGQRGRKIIFARALFGKSNDRVSVNGVKAAGGRAIGVGAGFDYYMSPRYSIRVVQADYLDTRIFNASQGDLRVSTGIVFHWGRAK